MTCIGAIRKVNKDGDVIIIIGADSCSSTKYRKIAEQEFVKIIKKNGMLIAMAGAACISNLITHTFVAPDRGLVTKAEPYLITQFIPALMEMLHLHKKLEIKNKVAKMDQFIILALDGSLFRIDVCFSVTNVKDYTASGSGVDYMLGALHATKNIKDSKKRLQKGLEAASLYDFNVTSPFYFEEIQYIKGIHVPFIAL